MQKEKASFEYQAFEKEEKTRDPISRYNQVIREYNNPINSKDGITLTEAYTDSFYRFWFHKLKSWFLVLFLIYLAPYLSFISLIFTIYTLIIHENSLQVDRTNRKLVADMFENMVYSQELCTARHSHNIYFAISLDDLDHFPFSKKTIEALKVRADEDRVGFMVYDREFVSNSESLSSPRKMIWSHLIVNIIVFVMMQLLVYSPLLCFDLLHPIESVSRCGEELSR